jgi:hypothetical protein
MALLLSLIFLKKHVLIKDEDLSCKVNQLVVLQQT